MILTKTPPACGRRRRRESCPFLLNAGHAPINGADAIITKKGSIDLEDGHHVMVEPIFQRTAMGNGEGLRLERQALGLWGWKDGWKDRHWSPLVDFPADR